MIIGEPNPAHPLVYSMMTMEEALSIFRHSNVLFFRFQVFRFTVVGQARSRYTFERPQLAAVISWYIYLKRVKVWLRLV